MSDLAGVLPRISIITPSYQQAAYLEECLRSVRVQDGVDVEHIVVDGGSDDGSREIIERNSTSLAWWCSERDKGQSDAINKGLARATGSVFGWLNSDDLLMPGALARVAAAFASDPERMVFGGRVLHRTSSGDSVLERLNDPRDERQLFCDPVVNQQATFWRMSAVKAVGGVDPVLRYVMDLELWWRLLFQHGTAHLQFEPVELAVFRLHDASKTMGEHGGFLDETASLLHDMCVKTGERDLAHVLATGHALRQGLRGIPVDTSHRPRVREMTLYFLLKWNASIHRKAQFRMMRALRAIGVDASDLTPDMAVRWERVNEQLGAGSWPLFRVQRKLKHLRS